MCISIQNESICRIQYQLKKIDLNFSQNLMESVEIKLRPIANSSVLASYKKLFLLNKS